MKVRRAGRSDVRRIRAIDAQVYPTPWSEAMTITQVEGRGRVHLVVEEDGDVIGHGGIALLDGDAHVTTIAIDPAHQRRGIGDVVMKHLFEAAAAQGCRAVTLEVRASNAAAIALYEKHGMVSAGVRTGYYADNGEDALIMWSQGSEAGTLGRGAERQWSDSVGLETDAQA